ncbi:MAG: response regulator [Chloroflexota bacterium]
MLRIIQEALTNVRKHADASQVRIVFAIRDNRLEISVEDDGCGFDREHASRRGSQHFGLRIMRERAPSIQPQEKGRRQWYRSRCPGRWRVSPMKLLLVDDQPLFLEGPQSLLAARGVEVVGTAGDGFEALAKARGLHPDVILMDVQMPRCNGLDATRMIKAEMPEARIVMLTVSGEDEDLFEAMRSGVSDYLLKSLCWSGTRPGRTATER